MEVSEIRGAFLRSLLYGNPTSWKSIFGIAHFRQPPSLDIAGGIPTIGVGVGFPQ